MRWDRGHQSNDVIDRRGEAPRGGGGGGSGMLVQLVFLLLRSRFGWIGAIVLVIGYVFVLPRLQSGQSFSSSTHHVSTPQEDELASFVGFVLDDVQSEWQRRSPIEGRPYRKAKLVLFTNATNTACGLGETATGPFYCPRDEQAYIDLGFYQALKNKLGAPGDFAQAYVIAHEIGHHLQNILGTSEQVHRAGRGQRDGDGGLSVRLELQADCYAGVWAHSANRRGLLEIGDVDEALTAATAIGDDTLQRNATGRVRPETFSHGTSAQRVKWFKIGLERGDPAACDTFEARNL
ncbi:MAG: neutral zinc metallopeptidase [Myxococcales bacterium]|nr:neutral zinc metallopeptidase [Myxococcales bacterium]